MITYYLPIREPILIIKHNYVNPSPSLVFVNMDTNVDLHMEFINQLKIISKPQTIGKNYVKDINKKMYVNMELDVNLYITKLIGKINQR